jgi:hypothetical protein
MIHCIPDDDIMNSVRKLRILKDSILQKITVVHHCSYSAFLRAMYLITSKALVSQRCAGTCLSNSTVL